jgi:hypothetical protein
MSPVPRVGIIVLNYNGQECLRACLRSLEKLRYEAKDIIIVDNGSQDGSLELAEQEFPRYTYLRNGKNLGFAGGMNAGMRAALARGADWCWLFNYDAEAEEETLAALMEKASRYPKGGLFSPLILEKGTDRVWFGGGRIRFWRMRAEHVSPGKQALSQPAYASGFLTGCALLIRKEVIERIGFLDERFFLYYEDADFCLRARKAGFEALVIPGAGAAWRKSRLNRQKPYHLVFSGLLFSKHAPPRFRPYLWAYVTIRRIKNRIDTLLGREGASVVHQAYDDFFRKNPSGYLPHLR